MRAAYGCIRVSSEDQSTAGDPRTWGGHEHAHMGGRRGAEAYGGAISVGPRSRCRPPNRRFHFVSMLRSMKRR
jgi:hypothetical protein